MLRQKVVLSYFSKVFLQVFQLGVTIVVARIAGASVLGTVAFATSFVSMFLIFFDMGQGVAHIKLVSEGQDESKCNGVYFRIQIFLSALFFLISMGVFLFSKLLLHKTFESKVHEQVIMVTIFSISISNLFSIPRTSFNARVEQAKADIPDLLRQVIYQILRLIVVIFGYRALAISISNLAANIIIIPVYLSLFRGTKWVKWDTTVFKKYLAIGFPVFITNIVDIVSTNADKVLLQFFYNSAEVGYYVAGFSIGGLITMVGNSVGLILLPTFSKDIANNDYKRISSLIEKFERFTWLFIFPATLIASIGSDIIVKTILGKGYLKSIPVLSILNFSAFFSTYFTIYGVVLSGKGYFRLNAKIYIAKLIFLLVTAFVFLYPGLLGMGSKGVAISLLLANIFAGFLFLLFVRRRISELVCIPSRQIILFSLLFAIPSFLVYGMTGSLLIKIFILVSIPVAFWSTLILLNLSGKDDYKEFLNLLSPSLMKKYIKNEIIPHSDRS